jgi:LemA protein
MGIVIAIIIVVVILGIAFWLIGGYNGLVRGRNAYKNAFAQIDVQLQRRFDLIPNLVETAKAYLQYEKGTLEAVVQARGAAMAGLSAARSDLTDAAAMQQLAQGEGQLNGALGRLFAITEAYPDLKANQNMMQLSEELTSTENKVAFARQAYNDSVMSYNNRRETFPTSVYAGMFNFAPAALLEIPEDRTDMREAPKVSFDAPQVNFGQSTPAAQPAPSAPPVSAPPAAAQLPPTEAGAAQAPPPAAQPPAAGPSGSVFPPQPPDSPSSTSQ